MAFFSQTVEIWIFLGLLLVGYLVGRSVERNHYASIHSREELAHQVPIITAKAVHDSRPVQSAVIAYGTVVVAIDYYKRFLMGLRNIVGGESKAYASLIDRARREAILRMRESAPDADLFLNFRLQTATIQGGRGGHATSVEIFAYATAVRFSSS